jgi:hypothetical protein
MNRGLGALYSGTERFDGAISNPFATRFVRPGAIPYYFAPGQDARAMVDDLKKRGWRGAIIGPHGSGKSTLLHALVPELVVAERDLVFITLRDNQRWLLRSHPRWRSLDDKSVLIIDGYEQLNRASRAVLWLRQKVRRFGVLVTAHTDVGYPAIARTQGDLTVLHRLIKEELPGDAGSIADDEIDRAFERRWGNLREALFDLYDLFERRRQPRPRL